MVLALPPQSACRVEVIRDRNHPPLPMPGGEWRSWIDGFDRLVPSRAGLYPADNFMPNNVVFVILFLQNK